MDRDWNFISDHHFDLITPFISPSIFYYSQLASGITIFVYICKRKRYNEFEIVKKGLT